MCGNVKQNAETEFRNLKLIIISAILRTVKSTGNEGSKDRQMERDKGYNSCNQVKVQPSMQCNTPKVTMNNPKQLFRLPTSIWELGPFCGLPIILPLEPNGTMLGLIFCYKVSSRNHQMVTLSQK